jgi:DNA-directed RNA polymerase subunit E'/Rpb7
MEALVFFEKKVNLRPEDLNRIDEDTTVSNLLERKIKAKLENKCSEHGFVIPDTVKLISHSIGYFEPARFTGDAVYYVKAEGLVLYPADGIVVDGEVIRVNRMGLYLNYRDGIRIQVPRDLNLDEALREKFEAIQIGDVVRVTLKKSLFQINDEYILTNGIFVGKVGEIGVTEEEGNEVEGNEGVNEGEIEEEAEGNEEDEENEEENEDENEEENVSNNNSNTASNSNGNNESAQQVAQSYNQKIQ